MPAPVEIADTDKPALALAVVALGFSAFITQVTLMRELVSVFAGNELIYGVVLGVWLLLTGLGSALGLTAGRLRRPLGLFLLSQLFIALLPIVAVLLLRGLRNVVFVRGAAVGVSETVLVCVVLLAPYCLLTGYLLTLASRIVPAREAPGGIGRVYFLDSLGGVVGGLLFSLLLVTWLDHFQILYVAAAACLVCVLPVAWGSGERGMAVAGVACLALVAGAATSLDLEDVTVRFLFRPQQIVYHGSSPYGSLAVTQSAGALNFFENGVPLFSTRDPEAAEETVHYAMAQRPEAQRVLLISGGVSGTAQEILKYGPAIDYVELDPLIIDIARRFVPQSLADPRIEVIPTDGRLFLRETQRRYDVILVDVPDPSTSQLNRFYTREFFAEAKRRLTPEGVLGFGLGRYENRIAGDLARLVAVAHRTLSAEFASVLVIPAGRLRFLASDGPLSTDIADRLEEHRIPVRLLDRHSLADKLRPDRMADVERAVADDAPLNRDFSPILYYHHLRYWMSQFRTSLGVLEALLIAAMAVFVLRLRSVSLAMFSCGLAASALEVVLLMGFQILYGSVYHRVGLIVTMFMLGLGIGSAIMNRVLGGRTRRDLVILEFVIAALAVCVPGVLVGLGTIGTSAAANILCQGVIYLTTLLLAILVGLVFPLAAKLDFQNAADTASRLYTADYLGAALGALLVSTLLIPLIGVTAVCLLAAGLNVMGGVVVGLGRPR